MSALPQLPEPQVIDRLPFGDYLKIDAAHSTGLKNILVSPRNYKARKDRPLKDNDTLALGRAGHTAIFEPEMFLRDYALWDKKLGKRDPRTEAYKDFLKVNAGKCVITTDQYDDAMRMKDAVWEHPIASELLKQKGRSELTLVWTHPRTGMRCKARIDRLCGNAIMGELKTCVDPSESAFWHVAKRLEYPVQFSLYRDGIIECLGVAPAVKCIAVQKKDPWDVVVHNIPLETVMAGTERVELALDRLAECNRTNTWPGQAWDREPDLKMSALDLGGANDDEPITFGDEEL